jgi:hypothetical protein
MCSSYLPLGVPNWTVTYIINTVLHQASFSFLKATLRFALLSLPNLHVSGENLNLWAVAALQRHFLLEGVALRQRGWWLSFELPEQLLVAVTPLLLCCGVPGLMLFLQVMLAGGGASILGRGEVFSSPASFLCFKPLGLHRISTFSFIASSVAFFSGSLCLA